MNLEQSVWVIYAEKMRVRSLGGGDTYEYNLKHSTDVVCVGVCIIGK